MKIAVPVTADNVIDSHFGHCEYYGIYTVSGNNEITESTRLDSPSGCGCKSNIASVLAADGVEVMLAGGIGQGAVSVLNNYGIEVIRGCAGPAEKMVRQYINGQVTDTGTNCQMHSHHHDHDHSCSH